jgi:hypothetical protein
VRGYLDNVRFTPNTGHKTPKSGHRKFHVCFTPKSGRNLNARQCPLIAISGRSAKANITPAFGLSLSRIGTLRCRHHAYRFTTALPPITDANPRRVIEKVFCSKPVAKADSIEACFLSPLPPCLSREYRRLSADFGGAPFVPLLNFLLSIEPHSLLRDALGRGNNSIWDYQKYDYRYRKVF